MQREGRHPRTALFVRRQMPFVAAFAALLVVGRLLGVRVDHPRWALLGAALVVAASILALVVPWERLPGRAYVVVLVLDIVAAGVLAAAAYGTVDTLAAIAAFPALTLAVGYGRWGAAAAVAGVFATALCPLLIAPERPSSLDWAAAIALSVVIGAATIVAAAYAERMRAGRVVMQAALAARQSAAAAAVGASAMLRSFADEVDLGLVFFDDEGTPVLFNQAAVDFGRLSGFDDASGASRQVYQADQVTPLADEDQPLVRLLRGEDVRDVMHWVGPRGGQRALTASGRHVLRPDGSRAGITLVIQDVTDAVRAGRAREDALATLAHELRTPLTSIVGYTDLLLAEDLPGASAARVDVIARNAAHLLSLTATFLGDLRRNAELHRERLLLRGLVDETLAVLEGTPGYADRDIRVEIDPALEIHADRDGIAAVLANLLSNAVKFSAAGDTVQVCAESDVRGLSIIVTNTGSTVDPEDLERIFDRFYRGGNARRDAVPGTGIGLSVSRQIVQAHGGSLTAESGGGRTAFRLRLPPG